MRERGGSGMILASSIQLLLHKIFKKYILHDEINNFLKGFQQRSLRNNEKYQKTMILAIDTLHQFFIQNLRGLWHPQTSFLGGKVRKL